MATRPLQSNGLGFIIAATLAELDMFEQSLVLLLDTPALNAEWKRLVTAHDVQGVKVHNTRLVAAMNVHGVAKILTFNTADFARFDVTAIPAAALLTFDTP